MRCELENKFDIEWQLVVFQKTRDIPAMKLNDRATIVKFANHHHHQFAKYRLAIKRGIEMNDGRQNRP
jgi:hypothetical protein